MADINIQIKQRNGAIWDNLFPRTVADNVQETLNKRFTSDVEMASKQDILGFTPENINNKGVPNGYAELDISGKVPANQLPSYVDDVLEYSNLSTLPVTGESGKIYITQDTNKTYRWSGTAYVEVSSSLALGDTSTSAYRGDRGKIAYEHTLVTHAPANAQKNSDITKAEIEAKLVGVITSHTHESSIPDTHSINHITGGSDVIPDAVSGGSSGLMSGSDKSKLNTVEIGANKSPNVTVSNSAPISPESLDFWYEII